MTTGTIRTAVVLTVAAVAIAAVPALRGQATEDLEFCEKGIERLEQELARVGDLNARRDAEGELDEALEALEKKDADDCRDALAEAFEHIGLSLFGPSPKAVRAAAIKAGLGSLATIPVPMPGNLDEFIRPGMEAVAVQLGKALFWDVQVGSDGQACGSCHFHAGADNRIKNQLNPGAKAGDKSFGMAVTAAGTAKGIAPSAFGPNYVLKAEDFPLRLLADTEEPNYGKRVALRDSNDVVSSQGVLKWRFDGIGAATRDAGTPQPDEVFHVGGVNVRRVEPRHTPSMINAVFNHDNFWDGRAQPEFNGVNPFGLMDDNAKILVVENGALTERRVIIPKASLASQAVGPPLSEDEMSYMARLFPDVGKKVLALRPMATQEVHPQDSVLGPLSRAAAGMPGLTTETYADMIRAVFHPQYWNSAQVVAFEGERRTIRDAAGAATSYNQMEGNFALFFGLAIQMYEATLVSDRTPFDRFLEGDDAALDPGQLIGLLTFINRGTPEDKANPVFAGVRAGNCVACHGGPELTNAGVTGNRAGIHVVDTPARMIAGRLEVGQSGELLMDKGFSNIGVRPTAEDIGRGGKEFGRFLSRQPLAGHTVVQLVEDAPPPPQLGIDGAFKIPGLRNVELTGPYFHNGGQATLKQVVKFYDRFADFADVNIAELDVNMARVDFEEKDEVFLVKFMLSLTDERVRNEAAPFDRPQIVVPTGHPGDHAAVLCAAGLVPCDDRFEVPAVGAGGRAAKGLAPLQPFLGIPQFNPAPDEEEEEDEA